MENPSRSIYTSALEEIPWYEKKVENYIDRITLVLGGTNSGKTTIIREIMYILQHHIPIVFVVTPKTSAPQYEYIIHPKCILEDISKDFFVNFWERQEHVTQIYTIANDFNVLASLFEKTKDASAMDHIRNVNRKMTEYLLKIDNSNIDAPTKDSQKAEVKRLSHNKIYEIYKHAVRCNREKLLAMFSVLDIKERVCVEYLDINPRILLIIDDRTENFNTWYKYFKPNEKNIFDCLFFRGRWNYVTCIIAAHDDKYIDSEHRKNARNIIYTQSSIMNASINRTANGISGIEKKKAARVCDRIFSNSSGKTYLKCCYVKDDNNPWKYIVADLYPDFTMGCDILREMLAKMPVKEDTLKDNPLVQRMCQSFK